ncbi:unnamed protein product [Orchesella dallaii]|uniref:Uncharacterized protein n=1 Tax=Orchesella dallaii TaxID=48710 RepID=A0ABP1R4X1_9HEXA
MPGSGNLPMIHAGGKPFMRAIKNKTAAETEAQKKAKLRKEKLEKRQANLNARSGVVQPIQIDEESQWEDIPDEPTDEVVIQTAPNVMVRNEDESPETSSQVTVMDPITELNATPSAAPRPKLNWKLRYADFHLLVNNVNTRSE